MSLPDMSPAERFAHGTRARYTKGCRCDGCRKANTLYERNRVRERIYGRSNGLVDAAPARAHLALLSAQGIGRRAVAAACEVGETIVHEVSTGKRVQIRRSTETRILAVNVDAAAPGVLVDARPTWKLLDGLMERGFTRGEIAKRLGYETPALQIGRFHVRASTAQRVKTIYGLMVRGQA